MKTNTLKRFSKTMLASSLCLAIAEPAFAKEAQAPSAKSVSEAIIRSADWQLANPSGREITDWVISPLYDGLFRTALATGERKYMEALVRFGQQAGWSPRWMPYNADDHAVGHAWLDVYLIDESRKERLKPMQDVFDFVIANPKTEYLDFREVRKSITYWDVIERWTWCDALYMAPPSLVRLHTATGDEKYLDFLDTEFRFTYDELWDSDARLFYRDTRYIEQRTDNGEKVFWSRGNGWVYAGLALLLERYPEDRPARKFYETLFLEMTTALLETQQPDGLWWPSLHDPKQIPQKETSGTALFAYGLAWGINNGLLDRQTHETPLYHAWEGLLTCVKEDGYVGYVQQIGSAPDAFTADSIQDYGTGAFLLAGSELLRLLDGASNVSASELLADAESAIEADRTPRAYARFVPERKDDLAWENDKVAFRIYGPALRDSVEDSGVDVWTKRVPYPILDKWYRLELAKKQSYHTDHGEGYDAYKVGDSLGCGGTGLLVDGELLTADTYVSADIYWTGPEELEYRATYQYPILSDGGRFFEHRTVKLKLGERLSEVTTFFARMQRNGRPLENFEYEVVIGLATQSSDAKITLQPKKGLAYMADKLGEDDLFTAISIDPSNVLKMESRPHAGEPKGTEHALVIAKPDSEGKVVYRTGFAWSKDGEIKTAAAWRKYLEKHAATK